MAEICPTITESSKCSDDCEWKSGKCAVNPSYTYEPLEPENEAGETEEQAATPLNMAERASLSAWVFALRQKYDVVGRLASAEEADRMAVAGRRQAEYLDRMEEMGETIEAREMLDAVWRADA